MNCWKRFGSRQKLRLADGDCNERQKLMWLQAAVLRKHEKVHGAGCNSIAFSPSGLHAATCGQDGVVRLWSTHDGTLSSELKPAHAQSASSINSVAFCQEKGMVMGASNDNSIKTWDMHTGRPRFTMTGTYPD